MRITRINFIYPEKIKKKKRLYLLEINFRKFKQTKPILFL